MKGRLLLSAACMLSAVGFAETETVDSSSVIGEPNKVQLVDIRAVGSDGDVMDIYAIKDGRMYPMRIIISGNGGATHALKAFVGDQVYSVQGFSNNRSEPAFDVKGVDIVKAG